jgi:uridine kinase
MPGERCFIIMSFDQRYDHVYASAIKPAVDEAGFECFRIDQNTAPMNIPHTIVQEIISSRLIIADISEPNPNVFYELGISHSVGNKTIIISQNLAHLPFDLKTEFTLGYADTKDGLRLLYFELVRAIRDLLAHPTQPSNLVQLAGQPFFDLRTKIKDNLQRLVDEGARMTAFQEYLSQGRQTDNSTVVNELAKEVLQVQAQSRRQCFVAISGAAGLGKTTLSDQLTAELKVLKKGLTVSILPTDAYMRDRADRLMQDLSGYDPRATDVEQLQQALQALADGQTIRVKPYDHKTGMHQDTRITVTPSDIVIVDGIHSLHPRALRWVKHRLFLYAAPEDGKELRFLVDLFERSYTVHAAFQHSEEEYRSFEKHVLHYVKCADRVVQIDAYWKYYL